MLTAPEHDHTPELDNVLWLCGSPCGGKSTISHLLAQIYVWVDYHADAWERAHWRRRILRGDQEALAAVRQSSDERWLIPTVEQLANSAAHSWMQDFPLVIEDLLALPDDNLILAEGIFFPAAVVPYLRRPLQALWLIPTAEFCQQARYRKWERLRERKLRHGIADEGSDPAQRLAKLIARDVLLADEMRRQATQFDVPWIEVDGTRSIEENLAAVERFYDPFLKAYYSQPATDERTAHMDAAQPTQPNTQWRIRPAQASDRAFLEELAPRLAIGIPPWRSAERMTATAKGWLLADLERAGQRAAMFIAETTAEGAAGTPIGAVAIAESQHFVGVAQAEVGELAVVPAWEGRGVGAALLAAAEAWAREQALPFISLATGAANTHALDFYARHGYQREDVRLTKPLAPAPE